MKILTEIHRASGINIRGKTIERTAVRAVIRNGREILLVYSANVGDYKFPGGGVNADESRAQALARELKEECGAELLGVDGELGAIVEYNFPIETDFDAFKMTSYYYFCRIKGTLAEQNLEGYERDLGFRPVWINVADALQNNKALLGAARQPEWLRREIFALEILASAA